MSFVWPRDFQLFIRECIKPLKNKKQADVSSIGSSNACRSCSNSGVDMLPHHSAPDGAVQPFWPNFSYKTIATSRAFKQRLRLHYKGLDYDLQYRYCVETAQVYVCTRKYYDVKGLLKPPHETWKDYIELDKCKKGYYLPGEGRLQEVNAAQAVKRRERRAHQGTLALPREVVQVEAALATDQQEHWTGSSWSAPTAASQQQWSNPSSWHSASSWSAGPERAWRQSWWDSQRS